MHIGFDAKRAFFNRSGLGNYSRDTIRALNQYYPDHDFHLYTPGLNDSRLWHESSDNLHICTPIIRQRRLGQAYWRSFSLSQRLKADEIDIYHGLSNELPYGIEKSGIKTVVTIHDLIFMRHPEWYNPFDTFIYKKKFAGSSRRANCIVTVSQQTKHDLIYYFGISEKKIEVVYQGCNVAFSHRLSEEDKQLVKSKWNLPDAYILYVGTVEERKNLLNVVRAIHQENIEISLVVIGRHTDYAKRVKKYIADNNLKNIYFLKEVPVEDLPGIYQMANLFIYPSLFEGFGIPVLEALYSGVPVITTKGGCFDEVGGENSIYIDPLNIEEIGDAISRVLNDTLLRATMRESGYKHAKLFSATGSAQQLMRLYTNLFNA